MLLVSYLIFQWIFFSRYFLRNQTQRSFLSLSLHLTLFCSAPCTISLDSMIAPWRIGEVYQDDVGGMFRSCHLLCDGTRYDMNREICCGRRGISFFCNFWFCIFCHVVIVYVICEYWTWMYMGTDGTLYCVGYNHKKDGCVSWRRWYDNIFDIYLMSYRTTFRLSVDLWWHDIWYLLFGVCDGDFLFLMHCQLTL